MYYREGIMINVFLTNLEIMKLKASLLVSRMPFKADLLGYLKNTLDRKQEA